MSSHVIYTSMVSCPLRCSITNRYMSKSLRSQRFGWLCFYWVFSSNWIMWQFVVHLLSFFFSVAGVFGAGTGWVWVNVEWTYFIWNVCQCISSVNGCHLGNPFIDVPPMKLMSSIGGPHIIIPSIGSFLELETVPQEMNLPWDNFNAVPKKTGAWFAASGWHF